MEHLSGMSSVSSSDTGSAPMQPCVFRAQVAGCSWSSDRPELGFHSCGLLSPVFQQHPGVTKLEVFSSFPLPVPHGLCFPGECFLLGISPLSSPGSFQLCLPSSGADTPSLCPHSFPEALLICKLDSDCFFGLLPSEKSGSKAGWVCYRSICGLLTEFPHAGF